MSKKVKIIVDGRELEVDASTNVLQAVLGKGHNLPYFCWHPALGSVGACRQCGVIQYKDEQDTQGRLVMSCMTPCTPWARFSIEHPDAKDMRAAVVEFLMTNHPHDCPVCEEGGHCHLQDMTVMTGHNYRRYRHTKRTHRNQDLGPFVSHEMNRCIACYRCVRYYKDYAGGKDLDNFGSAANVYFGRAEDGVLESEFSGNLVEVCPTGVFTDKPYGESYTRKWDLQTSPSICGHCSIGCNISPGERYGSLKRVENRYHGEINGYFICDRGRFGYGFVNREDRPRTPLIRALTPTLSRREREKEILPLPPGEAARSAGEGVVTAEHAVVHVAGLLKQGRTLGIGSPRASLETNYALKALVGTDNFYNGQSPRDAELTALGIEILQRSPAQIATIKQAEQADAVLVLGEDVLNTGARLALALRQSTRQAGFKLAAQAHIPLWQDASVRTLAQDVKSPLFVATPAATGLDEIAAATFRDDPAGIARLGFAVAHALDGSAAVIQNLDAKTLAEATKIAQALLAAERPLIVSGVNLGSAAVLLAAANVAAALVKAGRKPSISLVFGEANSVGLGLLGGNSLEGALKQMESGAVETVFVAENDLTRRVSEHRLDAALGRVKNVVVLDHIGTPTTQCATVLLPSGSFAESDGTLVNNEGRAQRYFQTFVTEAQNNGDVRESWRWLQDIARACGRELGDTLDSLTQACAQAVPTLAGIIAAAPNAKFRMAGARIPRQPHRYSGRTAMNAGKDVHEPRPPLDKDSPLAFSMEGATGLGAKPAPLIPMFWAPNWNSPQAVNKFQAEIGGALKSGDPGVQLFVGDRKAPSYYAAPSASAGGYISMTPAAGKAGSSGLQAVPLHHLFGSEEMSGQAPVMASRIPGAYLALNPATAAKAKLKDGAAALLGYNGSAVTLPVKFKPELPENCVGVPAGLPGVPAVEPGSAVKVNAA